jgi:hypothetical protein
LLELGLVTVTVTDLIYHRARLMFVTLLSPGLLSMAVNWQVEL